LPDDFPSFVLGELVRSRQLELEAPLFGGYEAVEFPRDLLDLPDAPFLGGQPEKVPQQLTRIAQQVRDDVGFRAGPELRVAQDRAQLGHDPNGRDEVAELFVDLLEPALLLGGVEQGLRVHAMDDCYFAASCSSTEKSRSLIASSIRRR